MNERPKTGGAWTHDDEGKLVPAVESHHVKGAAPQDGPATDQPRVGVEQLPDGSLSAEIAADQRADTEQPLDGSPAPEIADGKPRKGFFRR